MNSFASLLRAHGANPEKLYAVLGLSVPEKIMDFSTNTSVVPWTQPDFDLGSLASSYPDDECAELCRLISEREGIPAGSVLFTNGSNEALYLIASYMTGRHTAILNPAYPEYASALNAYGANVTDIFDLSGAGGFDAVFLSNPCNPTGGYISGLMDFARENPNTLFVIDEAYIDFLACGTRVKTNIVPNVIILRSLTKFYHLSGARAGYVIAPEDWADRLRSRRPTWSVNAFAQALSLRFLRDGEFSARSLDFYRRETPDFMRAVEGAGFGVRPSRVHFFLIDVRDDERVITGLMRRGLVVRHTRNFKGLDGNCVRVATRGHDDNTRFVSVLQELRKEGIY